MCVPNLICFLFEIKDCSEVEDTVCWKDSSSRKIRYHSIREIFCSKRNAFITSFGEILLINSSERKIHLYLLSEIQEFLYIWNIFASIGNSPNLLNPILERVENALTQHKNDKGQTYYQSKVDFL